MALVRNEDFVTFYTSMDGMLGPSLFLFCTRFNYGANFYDPFHEMFQYEYIYKGSIIRRSPGSSLIRSEELFFVIDMDAVSSPIEIPTEIWVYAFEQSQKSSLPFSIHPDVSVKLALMSKEHGFVLIAPISLLLLLCQQQVLLGMLQGADIIALSRDWEHAYGLVNSCELVQGGNGGKTPLYPINTLEPRIYLTSENVDTMLDILGRDGPFTLKEFVEELWVLSIPKYNRRKGKYDNGNEFQWEPRYIRDQECVKLLDEWSNTPRIRRCMRLGDSYAVNFEIPSVPGLLPSADASWSSFKFRAISADSVRPPAPARLEEEREYSVRELPYPPIPTIAKYYLSTALSQFAVFYRDEFNRLLKVVEWHGSYLLLRESEIYDIVRETKEGQDKWAKTVAEVRAKKAAGKKEKTGVKTEEEQTLEPVKETLAPKVSNLGMTWQQAEQVKKLLDQLLLLRKKIDDLIDVRAATTGFEMRELFEIYEELLELKSQIDKFAESGTVDTTKLDAEYFPAYDKFSEYVAPHMKDAWDFGNVPRQDSDEVKLVSVSGLPKFVDVILHDGGPEYIDQEPAARSQTFLSLATQSGRPTRFFTIQPEKAIQEEKGSLLQYATPGWLAKAGENMQDLFCRVLTALNDARLDVDIAWGDVLGNGRMREIRESPEIVEYLVARWRYDAVTESYIKLPDENLALFKALKKKALMPPEPVSATVEHLQWELLRKKQPDVYEQVVEEVNNIIQQAPKDPDQEALEEEHAEEDDLLPEWAKDSREDWVILKKTAKIIKYQTPDGSIVIEPSEEEEEADEIFREELDDEDLEDLEDY